MANTYLTRTFVSGGSGTTWTFSAWVKRSTLGGEQPIFSRYQSSSYQTFFGFAGSNQLVFKQVNAGSTTGNLTTNRLFRDTTAWYHIVAVWNTTNGTAGDRMKLYVNGVEETSFATDTNPSSGLASTWGNANPMEIARSQSAYFNGLMSHINFCDGTALAPTVFGETDATTGEWKIKTSPSFTLGTTGFTILKDGNTITDQSTNSNNWTLGAGTLTKTEDNPSNVFATWNVLDSHYFWGAAESSWCTNGNTKARSGNSQYSSCSATLGASSGKYYWEIKASAASNSEKYYQIGIKSKQDVNTSTGLGYNSGYYDYAYKGHDGSYVTNGSVTTYGNTYQVGDIVGVAMNLDNNKLYFSKNGTWQNSGVPTSGSTGTGAISITDPASTPFGFYLPAWSWQDGSSYGTIEANFGNGKFGTSAVSSAGSNASGNGIFEYDCPAGYTALSTKGLNT